MYLPEREGGGDGERYHTRSEAKNNVDVVDDDDDSDDDSDDSDDDDADRAATAAASTEAIKS